jgi:hypothetical protein
MACFAKRQNHYLKLSAEVIARQRPFSLVENGPHKEGHDAGIDVSLGVRFTLRYSPTASSWVINKKYMIGWHQASHSIWNYMKY